MANKNDNSRKLYDKWDHDVPWMIVHAKAANVNAEVDCLYPESFVLGILSTGENSVTSLLIRSNIDLEKCLKIFKSKLADKKNKKSPEENGNYDNLKKAKIMDEIMVAADSVSTDWGQDFINCQHIFVAILKICPEIRKTFEDNGLDFDNFLSGIKKHKAKKLTKQIKNDKPPSSNKGTALENFCVNMTELATQNKYDPIIARENEIEEAITILCRRNKSNPILIGEPGVGKAQPLYSKVLTINGWKRMGDIKIGDKIIRPDGGHSNVVGVYPQGEKDTYRVHFVDGRFTDASQEHLWKIYSRQKRKWDVLDTNYIISTMDKHRINILPYPERLYVPLVKDVINYREEDKYLIDPYIMGLLLGDGSFDGHSVRLTTADKEIVDLVNNRLSKDYELRWDGSKDKIGYRIIMSKYNKKGQYHKSDYGNKIKEEIDKIGLSKKDCYNKFIPTKYKNGSLQSKYDLIRGLLDSDGNVSKSGCIMFSTSSIKLAEDFREIIWSLGGTCKMKERIKFYTYKGKRKQGAINYQITIRHPFPLKLFLLKRKLDRVSKNYQYANSLKNEIVKIENIGKQECQCIKIDVSDGLYITDNYIVTHNTAIVEGICQRIVSNTVPKKLRGCRIYSVDIAGMVAGTKYRGEFEKRLQDLLKELKTDEGAILFIDEIHNIVGAGSASGSVDAANMMKPALARYLKCIGATTQAEYKKYFTSDGALERRFEKLDIDEPSKENVYKILNGVKSRLEDYHKCIITDDAIDMTIRLTDRYDPDRYFPDKAISCLDTACAKYAWQDNDNPTISPNDIAMVISKQTKIPMEMILWDNFERIKNTESLLLKRVIGQDHAVKAVCRTLKNAYSGIRNPDKPIGIFVFGGPTGTGKTYLAKELANILFSSDTSFIKIDMSEFSEPHSISKIIGSPPGYVGFNDVSIIADRIRRKPYCVLLLDEMEKAHPNVMKLFLQVMSDGVFTDSIGNKINCKNLILILTGNFNLNTKSSTSIGFGDAMSKTDIEKDQEKLVQYCKENFGGEFVNRIDDFISFSAFSEKDLTEITKLRLQDFINRIHNKNYKIIFNDGVAEKIVSMIKKDHGVNANAINRLIEKNLETSLADSFLNGKSNTLYTITVDMEDGDFCVKSKKIKKN